MNVMDENTKRRPSRKTTKVDFSSILSLEDGDSDKESDKDFERYLEMVS
jgi:hypothetical protein